MTVMLLLSRWQKPTSARSGLRPDPVESYTMKDLLLSSNFICFRIMHVQGTNMRLEKPRISMIWWALRERRQVQMSLVLKLADERPWALNLRVCNGPILENESRPLMRLTSLCAIIDKNKLYPRSDSIVNHTRVALFSESLTVQAYRHQDEYIQLYAHEQVR